MIAEISVIALSLVSLSSLFFSKGDYYERLKQITIIHKGLSGYYFAVLVLMDYHRHFYKPTNRDQYRLVEILPYH